LAHEAQRVKLTLHNRHAVRSAIGNPASRASAASSFNDLVRNRQKQPPASESEHPPDAVPTAPRETLRHAPEEATLPAVEPSAAKSDAAELRCINAGNGRLELPQISAETHAATKLKSANQGAFELANPELFDQ